MFTAAVIVRFRHCDPAGIVFYPRYFEILNDAVEDWVASLGWPFDAAIRELGVILPLVAVKASFLIPSRLGDTLTARIAVASLGRTSCALAAELLGPDGATRVRFRPTIVCVEAASLRPTPWPDPLRAAFAPFAA